MADHPFEIPKRLTLSMQAAAAIRKALENGLWHERLPGERRLCEFLHVSRPTIRSALQLLARDGLIETHRRRHRLLAPPSRPSSVQNRLVGVITQGPVSRMVPHATQGMSEIRATLAEHGFVTETIVCPPESGRAAVRACETFVRRNQLSCCVLISVSQRVQKWFARRSLPALVIGSCHEAVALPSIDVDLRAVCRHAAGVLLGHGHRHIAFVVQQSGLAGDLASERGFREAIARHQGSATVRADIVHHNGTAQHLTARLDALFASPHPPTALLVARPWAVFAVIIYLLRRGHTVPDAVSLISRDQDLLFETVDPPIAHYRFAGNAFVHRLTRLVLKLVDEGRLDLAPTLLSPQFYAGGTLKRPGR